MRSAGAHSKVIRVTNQMSIFRDKCLVLVDSLRRLGFEAEIEATLPKRSFLRDPRRNDLWIGHWNSVPVRNIPNRYIALQTEPMRVEDAWWTTKAEWIPMLEGAIEVWDYQESNRPVIDRLGRPFHHVPCGFSPLHETWFSAAAAEVDEPDIDVLLVGGTTPRRLRAIEQLRASGLRVEFVTYPDVAVGTELHQLIARSKLMLGIHRYDVPEGRMVDLFRFDMAFANAVPVLHERVEAASSMDQAFGERVAYYDVENVVDAVRERLEDLDEARAEAEELKKWFRDEWLIDRFIPVDRLRRVLGGETPSG